MWRSRRSVIKVASDRYMPEIGMMPSPSACKRLNAQCTDAWMHSAQGREAANRARGGEDLPEDELRMRHEVCDALEHAAGLEDEGGEGDFGEVHAHSAYEDVIPRDTSEKF